MKKTLFSLAFLAASGGYVAYANHGLDALLSGAAAPEGTATATLVAPEAGVSISPAALGDASMAAPATAPSSSLPPEPPSSSLSPIDDASVEAAAIDAAPALPPAAPAAPTPQVPPLPRQRPLVTPSIETAQAATVAANGGQYRDGTYTGTDENAYYGRVQVQVSVVSNRIASITPLDYPSDRRTSRYINSVALPRLQQEVMSAQSANVDTISGATLTSEAYIRSLRNALRKAAGGNA